MTETETKPEIEQPIQPMPAFIAHVLSLTPDENHNAVSLFQSTLLRVSLGKLRRLILPNAEDMAELMHCHSTTIYGMERGSFTPSLNMANRYVESLHNAAITQDNSEDDLISVFDSLAATNLKGDCECQT